MSDPLEQALIFILQVPFNVLIVVVMFRLMLQYTKADFYNPISQFTVKLTSPILVPMRRVIPSIGSIDTASFVLLFILQLVLLILVTAIKGVSVGTLLMLVSTLASLVDLMLTVYWFAILVVIIASWLSPGNYNPILSVLASVTQPILKPFRRVPPIAGMDFSPMLAMMAIIVTQILLIPLIMSLAGPISKPLL